MNSHTATNDTASIYLLNCGRGSAATENSLMEHAKDPNCFALLLQEPWNDPATHEPPTHPEFDRFTPNAKNPKCATYIKKTAALQPSTVLSSGTSFLGTRVTTKTLSFVIYNFYSPGRPGHLADLLKTLLPAPNCILMGDFNAHHLWWYADHSIGNDMVRNQKTASETIVEWLEQHNFELHNTPGTYTHFPRNGNNPSIIDLSLSRGNTSNRILHWSIKEDSGSDHALCGLHLDLTLPKTTLRRAWSLADWDTFRSLMKKDSLLRTPTTKEEALDLAEEITTAINDAVNTTVPLIDPKSYRYPWWNTKLHLLRKKTVKAERLARKHHGDEILRERGKSLRRNLKQEVAKAKETHREKLILNMDTKSLWKMLKHHNANQKPLPDLDGKSDFQEKCDVLRQTLFPNNDTTPPPIPNNFVHSSTDLSEEFSPIEPHEVTEALDKANLNSAPGHDKINYNVIRQVHSGNPALLPHLFTALLTHSAFPKSWKTANCVVIPKPGKDRYDTPKSYRPISLLPCISKTFEKIIAWRIADAGTRCAAISPDQYGARKNYSAVDAILKVITELNKHLSKPRKGGAKFNPLRPSLLLHDIDGAFNNTHPDLLLQVMTQRRMPTYLCEWTRAFTTDRALSFCFNNLREDPKPFTCGLAQGSPASPVLFLIYANAMLEPPKMKPAAERDLSYVDDVALTQASLDPIRATKRLKERSEHQIERGKSLQLSFSATKSELMHCIPNLSHSATRDLSKNPSLKLEDREVKPTDIVRYLGVNIDRSITFQRHASIAAANGKNAIASLNFLRTADKGLRPYVAHHLVKAMIFPKMLWASPAWWIPTDQVRNPISTVYNAAARWITGLPITTRNTHLLTCAHLPPLDAYMDYLSATYAIRLLFLPPNHSLGKPVYDPTTTSKPGLPRLYDLIKDLSTAPLEDCTTPTSGNIPQLKEPPHNPNKKETLNNKTHTDWLAKLSTHPTESLILYTDGSLLEDGRAGSGWIITSTNNITIATGSCHLGTSADILDAELHAIEEALAHIETLKHDPIKIIICCDNTKAIDLLSNNSLNSQHARNAIHTAQRLMNLKFEIATIWIPAHKGITGNNWADIKAKEGSIHPTRCCKAASTRQGMKRQARNTLLRRWKEILPLADPSFKYPKHLRFLHFTEAQALFRVRSRRTYQDHLHGQQPLDCDCGQLLSAQHILMDCPLFRWARNKLYDSITGPPELNNILYTPENTAAAIEFMKDTGLGFTERLRHNNSPVP